MKEEDFWKWESGEEIPLTEGDTAAQISSESMP